MATLSVRVKNWKPRSPSVRTCRVSLCNEKELLIHATTWMELEGTVWRKKACLQKLHAVWFVRVTFSKWQKSRDGEPIGGWRIGEQRGKGSECFYQWVARGRKLLHLTVVVILWIRTGDETAWNITRARINACKMPPLTCGWDWCPFPGFGKVHGDVRCHHWGKWGEGNMDPLSTVVITSCQSIVIWKRKVRQKILLEDVKEDPKDLLQNTEGRDGRMGRNGQGYGWK